MKYLAAIVFCFFSFSVFASSYKYEPATVTLSGKLVSADGETPDEEPLKFPALLLNKAIVVQGDQETPTEIGVVLLHMVLNDSTMKKFKKYKGRLVTVRGSLFHSDNGNHQTNVLITPVEITPAK